MVTAVASGADSKRLEGSVALAIEFLCRCQLPHGEFKTYASSDPEMGDALCFDSSPFATSFVVHALGFAGGPLVEGMTEKALGFLQAEMEGPGLWRYWSSRNRQHKLLPPDLDDTCCVSFVLKRHDRPLPPNRAILLANRNREGVFHTWLVPRSSSPSGQEACDGYAVNREALLFVYASGVVDDVDPVANANALLYLGDGDDTEGAVGYLVGLILQGKEDGCSAFYPDRLSLYYMVSRAYSHGVGSLACTGTPVTERILDMQLDDGSFGSPLSTALAVCTLLNYGTGRAAVHEAAEYLLGAQRGDGAWPRAPMFLGPAPYYGSEELTTALCVEALAKCRPGNAPGSWF